MVGRAKKTDWFLEGAVVSMLEAIGEVSFPQVTSNVQV